MTKGTLLADYDSKKVDHRLRFSYNPRLVALIKRHATQDAAALHEALDKGYIDAAALLRVYLVDQAEELTDQAKQQLEAALQRVEAAGLSMVRELTAHTGH